MRLHHLAITVGIAAAFLIAAALGGCGGKAPGPSNVLDQYSAALSRGDYATAYSYMSEQFRARVSKKQYVRLLKDNRRDVSATALRLREHNRRYEVSAEFRYGLGDRMRLRRENGTWSIATNPIRFYSQASPRDALRSFVRAYRLSRWDIILRLAPSNYRDRMTVEKIRKQFDGIRREEMASMMSMLEANIDEPIKDKGDEARMPYGDRFEVQFVREDGLWKIKDLD